MQVQYSLFFWSQFGSLIKKKKKIKKNIWVFNDYMFCFLSQTTGCLSLCLVLGR